MEMRLWCCRICRLGTFFRFRAGCLFGLCSLLGMGVRGSILGGVVHAKGSLIFL